MKETKVDKLGRIVIPISYRQKLKISAETELIIDCDNRCIRIMPIVNKCKLCDNDICEKRDIPICDECITKVKEM